MKYSYHWKDSMRFRSGLLWKTHHPELGEIYPNGKTYVIRLLLVLGLWGWVMTMDYQDQASSAIESKDKAVSQLVGCMNGNQQWVSEDGYEIACMKAVINKRSD